MAGFPFGMASIQLMVEVASCQSNAMVAFLPFLLAYWTPGGYRRIGFQRLVCRLQRLDLLQPGATDGATMQNHRFSTNHATNWGRTYLRSSGNQDGNLSAGDGLKCVPICEPQHGSA
jgi:hypothetical protein